MYHNHRKFPLLWVVMNISVVDWSGQRVLSGWAVISTVYCVSAWSPAISPVVTSSLGTMTLPFVQVTSYVYLQAPLAGGGDQERLTLGGILPSRVGASGGPGQAVAWNNTQ